MASIRERHGSYQITVSCGYDTQGKKLLETTTFTYNKTISKGVVLLILLSSKIGYTAGVATCSIIRSSTVDLYLYSYSKTVLR